jgi:cholesterol transport system auxiliary component
MSMPAQTARSLRSLAAALALAALAGCTGLATLKDVTEANDLYELTPVVDFDPALPETAAQIVVEEPAAVSAVDTDRIAVKPNPYQVLDLPKARWVDRAPLLVQAVLVESIENTGKVAAVGRRAIGLRANFTLLTELREFEAVMGPGEDPTFTASVRLTMKIVQEPDGLIVDSRSFAQQAVAQGVTRGGEALPVVTAFDTALRRAASEAVEWSVRRIAGIAR